MESRASHSHNKAKACYKAEARSKNLHQEATVPAGMRGGNGSFQVKKGKKSKDSTMQTKTQTSTVTPSTPTTLAPASTTASPATSRTPHDPAATALLITSATILTTEIPDEHAVGIIQGTSLTPATSEYKTKCSTEGELETSDKNSSKNIHETKSQISTSTDLQQKTPPAVVTTRTVLPKSVQQATFSQIPRTMSSPKLRSSPNPAIEVDQAKTFCKGRSKHKFKSNDNGACVVEDSQEVQSVQPLGTQQSKERGTFQRNKDEENRDRKEEEEEKEEEAIHKDIEVGCTLKGSELSPGATTSSISQVKQTAGKTDESAMSQERECEKEKRREWKEGMRKEGREALEKRGGHKGNDQEKKTEEKIEKDGKGQDKHSDTKNKEMREKEKKLIQIFKSFKDAAVMTEETPVPVQTLDAAMQTELLCKDAEIQAVVEVRNMSTSTSPNMTHSSWSQIDPMVNLNNHEKVSGTASMSLQNGHSQDVSLDSSLVPVTLASVGSMVRSLSPAHYKSSVFPKPTRQHVCEIQIELCSQSTLSDSLVLPEEKDSQASSTRSGLEMELKQVDQKGDRAGTSPLPEVAWDEQGMTWEVYGAAVDMESLGFAIQNHLQHKIQEHEQRIRHLRKSISISEHSNSDGKGARTEKKKKKRNVFWSLFQRPTCCFKTESEA